MQLLRRDEWVQLPFARRNHEKGGGTMSNEENDTIPDIVVEMWKKDQRTYKEGVK